MADMQAVQNNMGSSPAGEELLMLVGRLRRWHRTREWGFIFSELHKCDVFLDGVNADAASLSEGDLVLFELWTDEDGQPAARNARRAEPREVEQQQVFLAPLYQQYAANAPQAPELPRGADAPTASASSSAPARAPPLDGNGGAVPTMAPVAATPRHPDPLRRPPPPPPPPPPPSHTAPTGPGGFPQQALSSSSSNMVHQQPYLVPAQQNFGYPSYSCDRGFPSTGVYQQDPWPNGDGFSTAGPAAGSPTAQSPQASGSRLLLEPPHMLARLDPKAMVSVLKAGWSPGRRGQTFRSSRNGTAAQIGQEWCEILRQACAAVEQQTEDTDRHHVQASAQWGDAQWGWCATAPGPLDLPHGSGDPGLHVSASAG